MINKTKIQIESLNQNSPEKIDFNQNGLEKIESWLNRGISKNL